MTNDIKNNTSIKSPITKKKVPRCSFCKQKLRLICFNCQCGGVFCSVHRYAHSHKCEFIERQIETNKTKISMNNPKIEHDKLEKI
jgi:predicted nucleic acid binding AN1-type Zn finger protein